MDLLPRVGAGLKVASLLVVIAACEKIPGPPPPPPPPVGRVIVECTATAVAGGAMQADLHAVRVLADDSLVAVGAGGALITGPRTGPLSHTTLPTSSTLYGIDAGAGGVIAVVGERGTWAIGPVAALQLEQHSDQGTLRAVRWLSDGALLAVGAGGAFHRDATGTVKAEPTAPSDLWALDVASDGTVVAVGDVGRIATRTGDGTWRLEDHDTLWNYRGVRVFAAQDAVAVGDEGAVIRWTAAGWHPVNNATDEYLPHVDAATQSALFIGAQSGRVLRGGTAGPFVLESLGAPISVTSVWARTPNREVVVGRRGAVAIRRDGAWWPLTPLPFLARGATLGAGGRPTLVGAVGRIARIDLTSGEIEDLSVETRHTLRAAVVTGAAMIVVGGGGEAHSRDASGWTREETGVTSGLNAAVALPDGSIIAVGDGGVAVRRAANGAWFVESTGTDAQLTAVAAEPSGRVWAVGATGTILIREPGGLWTREPSEAIDGYDLRGVAHGTDGNIYVVGDSGGPFVFSPVGAWRPVPGRLSVPLTSILPGGRAVIFAGERASVGTADSAGVTLWSTAVTRSSHFRVAIVDSSGQLLLASRSGELWRLPACGGSD